LRIVFHENGFLKNHCRDINYANSVLLKRVLSMKGLAPGDGKKITLVTFDFLKFSKQLTERKLCGNFQKSPEKVNRFISVKILRQYSLP